MIDDIVPELLRILREEFEEGINESILISALKEKILNGKANYADADEYAYEVGKALEVTFQRNVSSATLPDGKMYYNIADRAIRPMLEQGYALTSSAAVQVQTALNQQAGIGIKAQTVATDDDRIKGIIEKICSEDQYDDVAWVLEEPVVNLLQSAVEAVLEANVEFQGQAGLSPKIIRTAEHKCCEWCSRLEKEYEYPNVPKEVYQRHDYCRCTVDYVAGKKRRNVHNNNTGKRRYVQDGYGGYTMSKETRIERARQMAETEKDRKEIARKKRIETRAIKMDLQFFAKHKRRKVPNDDPLWDSLVMGDVEQQLMDEIFEWEHGGYDYLIEIKERYTYNVLSKKKKPNINSRGIL